MSASISVVIPAYNAADTLVACLKSVCNQTLPAAEIIVVDNASTDNTARIIKNFQTDHPELKYCFESYRSRGAARAAGVHLAKGNIIAMLDADCLAPTDWLAKLTQPLINRQTKVAVGGTEDLSGLAWGRYLAQADADFFYRHSLNSQTNHLATSNCAFLASVFQVVAFDSQLKFMEDFDLALQLLFVDQVIYRHVDLTVGHHYQTTAWTAIATNFHRAYWAALIYRRWRGRHPTKSKLILSHPLSTSLTWWHLLTYPLWLIKTFFTASMAKFKFTAPYTLAWIIGGLLGRITPKALNNEI